MDNESLFQIVGGEEDTMMLNTKIQSDADSELLAALANDEDLLHNPASHPMDPSQLLNTNLEGATALKDIVTAITQDTTADLQRRKRRREAWEKQQEEQCRWELQCKLVDISTSMEILAREVAQARAEHKVALPDLDTLPEDEKLALENSHRRRMKDLLQNYCKKNLTTMMQHKWSWPFNTAVDTNIYKDYLNTVKNPMDFGSIKQRLDRNFYTHPDGFLSDIRLVFDNARLYNKPGSDVHVMATTLQEKFEEKYASSIASRVVEADALTKVEQLAARKRHAGNSNTNQESAHEAKINALIQKADEIYSQIGDSKGAAAALCAPVTRAEKEALVAALGRLPQQQFEGAVGLVMHHHPGLQPFDDVAFDLEMLDSLTLRQMQSYIASCQAVNNNANNDAAGEDGVIEELPAVHWPGLSLGAGLAQWRPPKRQRRTPAKQQKQQQEETNKSPAIVDVEEGQGATIATAADINNDEDNTIKHVASKPLDSQHETEQQQQQQHQQQPEEPGSDNKSNVEDEEPQKEQQQQQAEDEDQQQQQQEVEESVLAPTEEPQVTLATTTDEEIAAPSEYPQEGDSP